MENYIGVALDPRTEDKKALDYKHEDLAGAMPVVWKEKQPSEWKKYTPRYQNGSLSCVGQSFAKGFEIIGFDVTSAHPIYRMRANYPSGGMWLGDAGNIAKKNGTTTEVIDPSQNLGETALNLPITVPTPDKCLGYVFINNKKIDEVAQAIETQGHCVLTFHANSGEWLDIPKYNGQVINFGHAVTAVDYFMYENKKCILIEDSARNENTIDSKQQRIITEDYLIARCSGGIYITPNPVNPPFVFTKTLRLGSIGYDVKMLQMKLQIGADGLFGVKTKQAVIKYQLSHGLVGDGICGPITRIYLNR